MNCDWDSNTTTGLTSHIPIKKELKEEYDAWVDADCPDLWWWSKEQEREIKN